MQERKASHETTVGRIWCKTLMLTAAAFALEVNFTAIACYAVPVHLETGFQLKYASMLWAAPPVLGFFVHGYVGSASDRCKCSWGRRRPFILIFALIGGISLATFAYGKPLAEKLLHGRSELSFYVYPVAFVFMTFSLDLLDSPVRMYLLDSVPLELSDKANYIYSAMVALGAMFGSLIASVDWPGHFVSRPSTDTTTYLMQIVFGITLSVFVVCVTITLFSVKEQKPVNWRQESEYDIVASDGDTRNTSFSLPKSKNGEVWNSAECISGAAPLKMRDDKLQSGQIPSCALSEGNIEVDCISEEKRCIYRCVADIFENIRSTWEFIKHLSNPTLLLLLITFLDWFVLLTILIFFSDYVGEVVYGGSPTSDKPELTSVYVKGVQMSCWCMVIENLAMFVYSLLLERMSVCVSHRCLLLCGHLMLAISLGIAIFSQSIPTLLAMAIAEGVLYGNLYSIPYSLIHYYKEADLLLSKPWPCDSDTTGKAVSLLGMTMLLAQFITALFVGALIQYFSTPNTVFIICFISISLATVSSYFVVTKPVDSAGSSLLVVKCFISKVIQPY